MIHHITKDTYSAILEFTSRDEMNDAINDLHEQLFHGGVLSQYSGMYHSEVCVFNDLCIETDSEESIDDIVDYLKKNYGKVNEDFSMGVEGPTGLAQGIPQGGPGKGVLPKPIGPKPMGPMFYRPRHDVFWAVDLLNRNGIKTKKKKKHKNH